jgi:hypothetical protein
LAHSLSLPLSLSTAIVTIAVGPKARFFSRTLIQSICGSNYAGVEGKEGVSDVPVLYIVTDNPEALLASLPSATDACVASGAIAPVRVSRLPNGTSTLETAKGSVALPEIPLETVVRESRYGILSWARHSDYKRKRLEIKWLKTQLFTLSLLPDSVQFLLFMDSDMLIGRPLRPFLDHVLAPWGAAPSLAAAPAFACFTDIGHTGSIYHTGVLVFHRTTSTDVLALWGRTISRGIFGSDQRAIEYTVNRLGIQDRVVFASVDPADGYFAFLDGALIESRKAVTFTHTTTYRLTNGPLFGMTNETIRAYFGSVLDTDWHPWTGDNSMTTEDQVHQASEAVRLKVEYIERLRDVPFPRPTVIAAQEEELAVLQARLDELLALQEDEEA